MFQLKAEYLPGNPERLGVCRTENGFNFAIVSEAENIELCLFTEQGQEPALVIFLDAQYKFGSIFAVELRMNGLASLFYCYRIQGKTVVDPYAKSLKGAAEFGVKREGTDFVSPVFQEIFDWDGDHQLYIPLEDSVIYKLHIRGFTRHSSAKVEKRGTYDGIVEKIPYMKDLGITAVELMPVHEFEEVQKWTVEDNMSLYHPRFNGKTNYWGYTAGLYFAPKSAYCYDREEDVSAAFKRMVKELHKNHIEVILEMYFPVDTDINTIQNCVRFWVLEYHIDGIHLLCRDDVLRCICEDPLLSSIKLFATYWGNPDNRFKSRHLANYNNGFMNVSRKFLKGDENMLGAFVEAVKCNQEQAANVNYITNNNGFTLMDLVSYDRKHNEMNGESNRDGEDFNNSWNCGVEGHTRKKKILALRIKQIKNALVMVMLSQGVPLLMAGDEFGNTQEGNNNPYCQDNDISYINWKNTAYSKEILAFTKDLIAFRKKHGIFHNNHPLRDMDYKACGYPDISYHGENVWMADFENYVRNIGILYCGEYAADDFIFVAYNMHWEKHVMALPRLPDNYAWKCVFDTAGVKREQENYENTWTIMTEERSIVVLVGQKNA